MFDICNRYLAKTARLGTGAFVALFLVFINSAYAASAALQDKTSATKSAPPWALELKRQLEHIDQNHEGELGVYVEDLTTGVAVSLRADEHWYLASGIKVPVAMAILQMIDNGELNFDTKLSLLASDYVDGAGPTNWRKPNSKLSVRYLLKQMLTVSDNTASDILIRTAGIDTINQLAKELAPQGLGAATSLADVRRHAYSGFHESAFELSGQDFLKLRKQTEESARLTTLAELLGLDAAEFLLADIDSAFRAYYATNLNAGTLRAFASVLKGIVDQKTLQRQSTLYLLHLLTQVETGAARIKAGLPTAVTFAHKTGTQHRRACDLGIAISATEAAALERTLHYSPATVLLQSTTDAKAQPPRVIINACSRDFDSLASAEKALRAVAKAVSASGALAEVMQYAEADNNKS